MYNNWDVKNKKGAIQKVELYQGNWTYVYIDIFVHVLLSFLGKFHQNI